MPEPGDPVRLAAPAKLNLWLRVVGRRPDGYHELDTLMSLLDLADVLTRRPDGSELEVSGPHAGGVPGDSTNLAWRGWERGWDGRSPRGSLHLDKQVPVAAGLGGGSSDAAAAWRLARHAAEAGDEPADAATLEALTTIGADVPFFAARAATARVGGVGERIEPVDGPDRAEVVLVQPPFGLSTASVFGALTQADWSTATDVPELGHNDLWAAAVRLRSELDDVRRVIARAGGDPHLTGSGPTMFVLTEDLERAAWVADRVERSGLAATRTRLRAEPASIEAG